MYKNKGKSFMSNFNAVDYRQERERVSSDLSGKLPKSINGTRNHCISTVRFTRYLHVVGISCKSDKIDLLDSYKTQTTVVKHYPNGVQCLHTDGGGAHQNFEVVAHSWTCASTPQHKPFLKRINKNLMEPTPVLFEQTDLAAKYWEAGIEHVELIKNRLPHSALGCSPF